MCCVLITPEKHNRETSCSEVQSRHCAFRAYLFTLSYWVSNVFFSTNFETIPYDQTLRSDRFDHVEELGSVLVFCESRQARFETHKFFATGVNDNTMNERHTLATLNHCLFLSDPVFVSRTPPSPGGSDTLNSSRQT